MTHWPKAHIDTESIGWGESFKRVKERLGRGAVAVFDSTAVTTQVREKCLRLAKESSASAHIVLLNTSPGKCGVRNAERIDPVPDEVIAELRAAFESAQAEIPNEPWDSVTIL
jgi:predicted kinase